MSQFSTGYAGLVASPPTIVSARSWGGMIHGAFDVYAPGVAIVNGWVVRLARIPAGARIRGGLLEVTSSFGAGGTQANFGFTGAPTALLTNQALSVTAFIPFDREARGVGSIVPGPFGTDTDVIMTVTGVASGTTNGRLLIYLDYQL